MRSMSRVITKRMPRPTSRFWRRICGAMLFGLFLEALRIQAQASRPAQAQKPKAPETNEISDESEPCPGSRLKTGEASFQKYAVRTYRFPNAFGCVVISRDGKPAYKRTGLVFQIGGSPDLPLEGKQDELTPIGTDVTGLGIPDLVIGEWTGGAHCCFVFHVFELGPEKLRKAATIDGKHSDRAQFQDIDHDGRFEFLMNDWTFAYWRTGFMQSPTPDLILRFRDGKFRLALDLMRKPSPTDGELAQRAKDIAQKWDSFESGPPHEYWGELLELIYSGNAESAWRFADQCWPRDKDGKEEFMRDFRKQLRQSPYWDELRELNGHALK